MGRHSNENVDAELARLEREAAKDLRDNPPTKDDIRRADEMEK